MLNYFDLSDKERSELTEEDLTKYLDFELMKSGIIKIQHPGPEPLPPKLEKTELWYRCCGIYFKKIEDANTFAGLDIYKKEYDYKIGYDNYWISSETSIEISTEKFPSYENIQKNKIELIKYKEEKNIWDKRYFDYQNNEKEVTDICSSIWQDYKDIKNSIEDYKKIINIYKQYCQMTNGNENMAYNFLFKLKEYKPFFIKEAFEWFNVSIPGVINV